MNLINNYGLFFTYRLLFFYCDRAVEISKRLQKKRDLGKTVYEMPHLDELLRMIQDEDMLIEVLDEERRRLDQGGINGCKEMYLAMSYERYLL